MQFGVAEGLSVCRLAAIEDKGGVLVFAYPLDDDRPEGRAVRPAALEIGGPVDAIIERTDEMKVLADQRLDGGSVLGHIGLITRARDGNEVVRHGRSFCMRFASSDEGRMPVTSRSFL
jgi:hypothetical protein